MQIPRGPFLQTDVKNTSMGDISFVGFRYKRNINWNVDTDAMVIHTKSGSTFFATNFSSYIIELLQLYDTIQMKCNYAWIHYNIAIRSHLMI